MTEKQRDDTVVELMQRFADLDSRMDGQEEDAEELGVRVRELEAASREIAHVAKRLGQLFVALGSVIGEGPDVTV